MVSAIILNAGLGSRTFQVIPKQYIQIAGRPMLMHTLERLEKIESIGEIIVVSHKDYIATVKEYISSYNLKKTYDIVLGGTTRQESVYIGLQHANFDSVMIHESARPFMRTNEFVELIEDSRENVTIGMDIPFTVLQRNGNTISGLLQRSYLVNIQLPQKFNKSLLLSAHIKAIKDGVIFTEDASLLYAYEDCEIGIMAGSPYNIKITTNVDILIAEIIYQEYMLGEHI